MHILRERRLWWFGHVGRSSGAVRTTCDIQIDCRRGAGRPKLSWEKLIEERLPWVEAHDSWPSRMEHLEIRRLIWSYGQRIFNNIFKYLPKSTPACSAVKALSENVLRFFLQWFIYNFGLMVPGTRCFPYHWVPTANESRTLFLMTSLKYYCILGLAEIKTLHPSDKIMRKRCRMRR